MITTFIKLFDVLARAIKLIRDNKHAKFAKLIVPIFTDLQTIHNDYLMMLTKAKITLERDRDIRKAAEILMIDRVERIALRRSTIEVVSAIIKLKPNSKYRTFFDRIIYYFFGIPVSTYIPSIHESRSIVAFRAMIERASKSPDRIIPEVRDYEEICTVDNTIDNLNESIDEITVAWESLASEYGRLLGKHYN